MAKMSMLLDESTTSKKKETLPNIPAKWIHYSKLKTGKFQYRDKGKTPEELREEAIDLSVSIELAEGLLEYPLVRKIDTDEYEIISGHTRVRACTYLAEELGKKEYEFIPCHVRNLSDEDADYCTSSGNIRKISTQAEILHEIENERKRAEKVADPDDKGRLVERLARKYNMAPSVVGDYINISNNLSEKGREMLEEGKLKKSAAVSMAGLPEEEQEQLINAGVTSHKQIKAYKKEKQKAEQKTTQKTETLTDDMHKGEKEHHLQIVSGCRNCKRPTRREDTFVFFNKSYCTNCLHDLIKDLDETGVITLDTSEKFEKGIIVRF